MCRAVRTGPARRFARGGALFADAALRGVRSAPRCPQRSEVSVRGRETTQTHVPRAGLIRDH